MKRPTLSTTFHRPQMGLGAADITDEGVTGPGWEYIVLSHGCELRGPRLPKFGAMNLRDVLREKEVWVDTCMAVVRYLNRFATGAVGTRRLALGISRSWCVGESDNFRLFLLVLFPDFPRRRLWRCCFARRRR